MGVPCGGMLIRKLWVLVFSTNHRNGAAGSLCCAVGAAQWFLIKAYVFNCDSNVPMCLSLYVLESRNCIPFLLSSFSLFRIRCVIRNLRKFVGNRSSIAQELHICLLWNHIISGSAIKRKVGFPEIQYRACYVKEICIWEIPAPDYQIASLCLWSHSIINLLFVPISIDYDVLFYSLICIAQDFLFYFQRLIILEREREREKEKANTHALKYWFFPQTPAVFEPELRPKLRARNKIQVSCESVRDPISWTIRWCLPGSALARTEEP